MKVCKLVKLSKKDTEGNFEKSEKGEGYVTVRNRAVVSEATVAEFEANYKSNGLLYIVDEKATEARDKEVEAEANAANGIEVKEVIKLEATPAAKEPAAKEPAAKEPAAKEPAAKEPAAKEPAAKEGEKAGDTL